jgi:acetyl-CoA synthetase
LQNGKCLKEQGIQGDRVCIPELAITTLACARVEPFTLFFAGFSASAVAARINDSECKWSSLQMVAIAGTKQLVKSIVDSTY